MITEKVILEVVEGPDEKQSFTLDRYGTVVIGRSPQLCTFALTDICLVRRHCQIEFSAEVLTVRDLASPSGTYVNGLSSSRRGETVKLRDGDLINVGRTTLRVHRQAVSSAGESGA